MVVDKKLSTTFSYSFEGKNFGSEKESKTKNFRKVYPTILRESKCGLCEAKFRQKNNKEENENIIFSMPYGEIP